MVLSDAIAVVNDAIGPRLDAKLTGSEVEICSGGLRTDKKAPTPALYSTPELATQAWVAQAMVYLDKNPDIWLNWTQKPELFAFQMTVMNKRDATHRVTDDRWAVSGTLATKPMEFPTNVYG